MAKKLQREPAPLPAHPTEISTQCDTCIWPISGEFHLIQGDPITKKYLSFPSQASWLSNTASIKDITGALNHLSKGNNELKGMVGVKEASPWITRDTSDSVQKSRSDKASPYWPPITSNKNSSHASQRDTLHPTKSHLSPTACLPGPTTFASVPVRVSQTPVPLSLLSIRTLAEAMNTQA